MSIITLRPLTQELLLQVGRWREEIRESLRTVPLRTQQEQFEFYLHPPEDSRWWALSLSTLAPPVGMGGLTGIQWENGLAEISLILDPVVWGKGYGKAAVHAILGEAFHRMRLHQVVGECYGCSPALPFWQALVREWNGGFVMLPQRKYWAGQWFPSFSFWFWQEDYPPLQPGEEVSTPVEEEPHE